VRATSKGVAVKKNFLPILFVIAACAPDIAQNPPPAGGVIAQFDPGNVAIPIVPAPNDLALATGKIVVPLPHGCQDFSDPANPHLVPAPGAPATAANGQRDADETDVDCGGTSTNACDADKACAIDEDCASGMCTAGKCVGGCPSAAQQELNTKYLGTLTGFPFESQASVTFTGELDPASVNDKTVLAFDVTDPANPAPVTIEPVYGNKKILIDPPKPDGVWTRGHKYAIVLRGGAAGGLRGAAQEDVIGSQTWALVSAHTSLVTCEDLTSPDCKPAVDVIPSHEQDPAARLKEQTALALQLEQIRRGYDAILTGLDAKGVVPRADVPLLWTFSIVDAGEVTFDPANNTVPFPNDILRDPKTGNVNLPNPKTFKPLTADDCSAAQTDLQVLLVCGLNTLDGFSTIAPPISENSDAAGAVAQATIDPASLNPKSVGLLQVKAGFAGETTPPKFTPCLNCTSSKDANGAVPANAPQQLQWSLEAPLDEKSTYLAYVSGDVKDSTGKNVIANPVMALLRSTQPLVGEDGKSTVTLISDAQASQLEPLRVGLKPALDALEAGGVPRSNMALAFAFSTQSESSVLDQLRGLPTASGVLLGIPGDPLATADVTGAFTAAAGAGGIPIDNVDKFFGGVFYTPVLVTGTAGTFNPDPKKAVAKQMKFVIATPKTPGPWPITIFGHGLTRNKNDFLAIANALTGAGQMVIATDILFHGDRSSCTGSKTATADALPAGVTPSDDFACASPAAGGGTMTCDEGTPLGLCVNTTGQRDACTPGIAGDVACTTAGQGLCAADSKCQGAGADLKRDASGVPPISGWNIISLTNFFATRDNFRQQVIDLSQLVRVLKSTTPTKNLVAQLSAANGAEVTLDTGKINYVGQSLGGILGTLFNAVSPDTINVALNVPGGTLTLLFLDSPTLAPQRKVLLDTLAGQGLQPGTPAFDQFISIIQWILDPADPTNMGWRLTHPTDTGSGASPRADRKAFLQFIQGDQFVINESNLALVAGANRSFDPNAAPSYGCAAPLFCWEFLEAGAQSSSPAGGSPPFDATSAPPDNRHGFLLKPPSATPEGLAITGAAQTQVATFIATGVGP
jgi:hypothetical protein